MFRLLGFRVEDVHAFELSWLGVLHERWRCLGMNSME